MKSAILRTVLASLLLALAFLSAQAQQSTSPVQGNAGSPAASSTATGNPDSSLSPKNQSASQASPPASTPSPKMPAANPAATVIGGNSRATDPSVDQVDDNPYDPILEPPPLPKGKATLIGGIATSVDHVRNRMTIQPFGGRAKIKIVVDERSHIYRDGAETTVLGVHKGDRVYADTMLDGTKILAKNVRVSTQSGLAEVRGQVIGVNPEQGTISVRDQLSAKPVTFAVNGSTRYSSSKGSANPGDVQLGSLIDVQFSPRRDEKMFAQEIVVLAKPGDDYVFSGVVSNLDMRTSSLTVQNRSDDQPYEVHFSSAALSDPRALKVGSEVTARAVFDGKQYQASNVRVEKASDDEGEQSKAQ